MEHESPFLDMFTIGSYKLFLYPPCFSAPLGRLPEKCIFPCQQFWMEQMCSSIPNPPAMPAPEIWYVESVDCFADVEQDLPTSHQI